MPRRPRIDLATASFILMLGAAAPLVGTGCHGAYESGMDALAEGNYAAARARGEEALKAQPDDPAAHLLVADAHVAQGDYRKAEPHARAAFESGALPASAGRTYGKVLWELGHPIEAVEAWRVARGADPTSVPEEEYVRAVETALSMAESNRDYERVLGFRDELRALRPDHPLVTPDAYVTTREELARGLVREGQFERAAELYAELAKADPANRAYAFEQGRLLAQLGRTDEAVEAFERYAASDDPGERASRLREVAERAREVGAPQVAETFYTDALVALRDKPGLARAALHLDLAGLYLDAGDRDRGREQLRAYVADMRATRGVPVAATVYLKAAQAAEKGGDAELAIELLEEAIEQAAPSWQISRNLAELYARRARSNEVERVLRRFVERADDGVGARLDVGRWAASRRNFELARLFLEEAARDQQGNAEVWLELARVYSALNYHDEVRRALNAYTRHADDRRRALLDVAGIYRGQRMYAEAERAMLDALKAEPTDMLVVKQLESLYREWGRPKAVHDVYERWLKARGTSADDLHEVGERFYRQNEWDDALPYLHRAARAGKAEAWLQVADVYKRQRKERDMKEALEAYLKAAEDRPRALAAVWQRYKTSAWSHEAEPILEELIELEAGNILHYQDLSDLYLEQGRDVEAFELWKQYIELSPNPIVAIEAMAQRFNRPGQEDWMLTFLHQLVERTPDPDPQLYRLLGDAYDSLISRNQMTSVADAHAIFTEGNKAREYYERYLDEADPSRSELESFAGQMKRKQHWEIAAQAYEALGTGPTSGTSELLSYGQVLLELGRAEEAERIFADFYARRGKGVEAARALGRSLFEARRYAAAEPYLRQMMDAGDEALLRKAFIDLAEVYRNGDRGEEIGGLVTEYLQKTQNPTEARRTILQVLEGAGLYAEAAEQLERMIEVQGDELGYELGVNLYRAGDEERAEEALRAFAANNVNPAEAWLRVATFYEGRAEADAAERAYASAINAAGRDDEQLLVERGRFRILSGRVEEGLADLESARARLPHAAKGPVWRVEVQALLDAGRYGRAREAAREAVGASQLDKDFFYRVIADAELGGVDQDGAGRMVEELRASGVSTETVVELLVSHGYLESAAEVIDEELAGGDYVMGEAMLLRYADVFTELGGIERLMRSVRPLLDAERRRSSVVGSLGTYLVREGRYDQGALLLRAAVESGQEDHRFRLADTYLVLGQHDEALRQFQAVLAAAADNEIGAYLSAMGQRMELLGQRDRFEAWVGQLAGDPRYVRDAAPLLVQYHLERGQPKLATALLEGMWSTELDEPGRPRLSLAEDRSDVASSVLAAGLEILAAEGYAAEAVGLLERAPSALRESARLRDVRLRLAAFSPAFDVGAEVDQALGRLGRSAEEAKQALKLASLLSTGGHFARARAIALPYLGSSDYQVSRAALSTLLQAAYAADDLGDLESWLATFVGTSADRVGARTDAMLYLTLVGLDDRALELARRNVREVPTASHAEQYMRVAQLAGDAGAMDEAAEAVWRTAGRPMDGMPIYASMWHDRQRPALTRPVLEPYRAAYTAELAGLETEVQTAYRAGDPTRARELLLDYLDAAAWDPSAVDRALQLLDVLGLPGDAARLVGPRIPEGKRSVEALRRLGLANLRLGDGEAADALLAAHLKAAPDRAHAAAALADAVLQIGDADRAARLAQQAIDEAPERPAGYLYRGLARLMKGDGEAARVDLDRSLTEGINRKVALARIVRLASKAGLTDVVERYADQLIVAPPTASNLAELNPVEGLTLVTASLQTPEQTREVVERLQARRPQLAAGDGVAGQNGTVSVAGLYENAGLQEQSFALYEDAIRRMQLRYPFSTSIPTYQNNLAYAYSTAGRNTAEGLARIRTAIATVGDRQPSFIDTAGWLLWREGRLAEAEAEIRRALRSTAAGEGTRELREHLADVLDAQGRHEEAIWVRYFIDRE